MRDDGILVSICCITYNHEKYIREALNGFLMQKTNFKYEVIIHDDASTDSTTSIIKEYEKKYPEIIKPIYQTVNQYSLGKKKPSLIAMEKAKGKYIALCEGDDYWIDANKLQIQVDYMENNPKCTFCFHNANILDMRSNKIIKTFIPHYKNQKKYIKADNKYNVAEIALLNEIPTASYMFRNDIEFPEWMEKAIAGDICVQLVSTSYGYAYYIDKIMSVYRVGTGTSMMDLWEKQKIDKEKESKRLQKYIEIYERINEFSNNKYEDVFNEIINKLKLQILYINENIELKKEEYTKIYEKLSIKGKIKFVLRVKFKKIFYFLKKLKKLRS